VPSCILKVPPRIVKPYAHPVNRIAIVFVEFIPSTNTRKINIHWEPEIEVVKSEHKAL